MNEINQQVTRARRRLLLGRFFSVFCWALFGSLLVANIGLAIPKIWHLGFLESQGHKDAWLYSWILGSVVVGFILTAVLTWRSRPSQLSTAVEVDQRFGLKERLSSAISLNPGDAETPAGQSLLRDAQDRAEGIDIADQFSVKPKWTALLPLAPMLLMAALIFIPDAKQQAVAVEPGDGFDRKQLEVEVKEFKKQVDEKRKQLDAMGLKDASEKLDSLGKKIDKLLDDKDIDRKEALIKLNDIKKQIEDEKNKLGDREELKKQLNKLQELEQGPAKDLSKALKDGDFEKAKKAAQELADKLAKGELKPEEVKKLAENLEKMAEQIKEAVAEQERKKKELQDQIEKAKQEGNLDKAAKLQEKLDQMQQQQQQQQQQMKDLAQKLQNCAQCMKEGQQGDAMKQAMQDAQQGLQEMAEQMQQMQQQMEQMEALQDLEDMAGECKGNCQGEGQGPGDPNQPPKWQDWAKGGGRGAGKRDMAEDTENGTFKARVKGDVKQGETVVTGNAGGQNITGRTTTETKELVRATMEKEIDPLENQKLSKKQREHAEQYFRALRENQ